MLDEDVARAKEFGATVRKARAAAMLTEEELAERLGCSPATIRWIEANGLEPTFLRLTHLLGSVPEIGSWSLLDA